MEWKEVDGKVATRCIISFSGSSPIFDYSREHNIYAPVIMKEIDGSIFLTLLIEGSGPLSNSKGFFLKKFNAKEMDGFWYAKFPLESFDGNEILEQINEMPSVVMGYLYLKNGRFFADFRFHPSKSSDISSLLMNCLEKDEGIAIESLFPGSGEASFLTEMNAQTPLSLVRFSISLYDDPLEKCLSTGDGIAQVEKKAGVKYRALIYLESPPDEKDYVTKIVDGEHIYEAEGNNPILQEIRRMSNDRVIFRVSHFARVIQKKLMVSVFLPSYQVGDFLKILAKVRMEMKENLILHCVQSFCPDLFGFV